MKPSDANFFVRKRYYVIICLLISRIVLSLLRLNLSICLVDMTSSKTITLNGTSFLKEADFRFSSIEIGIILSTFSSAFFLAPVGGIIATRMGGVNSLGFGILGIGILTTLSPISLKLHVILFIVNRFVQGAFEAISFPGQGEIFMHWIPPDERAFLVSFASLGYSLGNLLSYPVCGYLTYVFDWETTFYITGGISIIWALIWLLLVEETPAQDRFMKKVEKNYFNQLHMTPSVEKIVHPWRKMFTSSALWVLLNGSFCEAWSASLFGNCLPLYFKDVYNVNVEKVGWLCSIPACFMIFGKIPASLLADYLRRNAIWNKTSVHKIFIGCAQVGVIITLIITSVSKNLLFSVSVFCTNSVLFSMALVSYYMLPLDIGARHSSFIFSLCYMFRGLGMTLNPLTIGVVVKTQTFAEWSQYFLILSLFHVFSGITFLCFGSGELQQWAATNRNVPTEHEYTQISNLKRLNKKLLQNETAGAL